MSSIKNNPHSYQKGETKNPPPHKIKILFFISHHASCNDSISNKGKWKRKKGKYFRYKAPLIVCFLVIDLLVTLHLLCIYFASSAAGPSALWSTALFDTLNYFPWEWHPRHYFLGGQFLCPEASQKERASTVEGKSFKKKQCLLPCWIGDWKRRSKVTRDRQRYTINLDTLIWLSVLRCKAWSIALRGCDHAAGKSCETWARLFVRLDPCLARRRGSHAILLLLRRTGQFTSYTSVPKWLPSLLQKSMTHRLLHMIYCVYSGSQVRILAYSRNSRIP
jgi:hypothetical protein